MGLDITEDYAITLLKSKGYRQSKTLNWLQPYKEYIPTSLEIACIDLLCETRDLGSLAGYVMPGDKAMEYSFIIELKED